MKEINIDVSKIVQSDTIETLAQKSGVPLEEIVKIGLDPKGKIGSQKNNIVHSYRINGRYTQPTRKQIEILKELGIILERKNIIQEFIEKLEKMQSIGIDVSKITTLDTIETLAKKSGVTVEEIVKIGLDPKEKIGNKKKNISQAYRGIGKSKPPTKEEVQRINELGISVDKRSRTGKEIAKATISSLKDIEMADREDEALKYLEEKTEKANKGLT